MRALAGGILAVFIVSAGSARAETIKLHCTMPNDPKSEAEDYVVDTEANTVTATLRTVKGREISSSTYAADISSSAIDWTAQNQNGSWKQRFDRAAGTLTSSNGDKETVTEHCTVTN